LYDLKEQLRASERRNSEFDILKAKFNKMSEENQVMAETIRTLLAQNQSILDTQADVSQNQNNYNEESIKYGEKDPIVQEVIYQKLNEKIMDLQSELAAIKNTNDE